MKELYCEKSYWAEKLCSECYYKDLTKQELHREDGPAKIEYYCNGNIEHEEYYKDGVLHREYGPVQTSYYEMGSNRKQSERYLIRDSKGELLDDIYIYYYSNGNVDYESHSKGNKHHRENGPATTQYYENGNKKFEVYYIEGKPHRENGPASTQYYENGNKKHEIYYKDGVRHREDGPSKIEYYDNGKIETEEYYKYGVLHRENGPAITHYYENGNKKYDEYYKEGKPHREDGPAVIWYREDGSKECEKYFIEDKLHRENGPAIIWYREDGNKEFEEYFKNGERHRDVGPTRIWYREDGNEKRVEYYINGEKCDAEYAEYIKNNIEKNKQNIICDKSYDRNINDFIGRTVRHFKGNEYLVLCTALNTESDEIMVIYKALYGENITYARPLKMFMEEVPSNKENPTGQKYRFQLAYL